MSEPTEELQEGATARSKPDPLSKTKQLIGLGQLLLLAFGTATAIVSAIKANPWVLWVGVLVALSGLLWFLITQWLQRNRRPTLSLIKVTATDRAILRGLLPFEEGDQILGRTQDIRALVAKLTSSEFYFGYLTGDAGTGKTSVIRAAIVPRLRESGYTVAYLDRPSTDPIAAMERCLTKSHGSTQEPMRAESDNNQGKRRILIWDQFEEFFVMNRTEASRQKLISYIAELYGRTGTASFIVLRKEFVADLQDFSAFIPQPLDSRFSHHLRNWAADEAEAVLNAAILHDDVRFAPALISSVIRDLAQAGEVRPVELQLVATKMKEHEVWDVHTYRNAGRARGLIGSYIKEVIEPSGSVADALSRHVARVTLRALCSDSGATKRPNGLTLEQFTDLTVATLSSSEYSQLSGSRNSIRRLLTTVLQRCLQAYIVILEDEDRYNLIHDYIVGPIIDLTSDIETAETQANRLLDRYIEDFRTGRVRFIPRKHYLFIVRNAEFGRKAELPARDLLKKTKQFHTFRNVGTVVMCALLALAVFPPRVRYSERTVSFGNGAWSFDQRLRTALFVPGDSAEHAFVWRVGSSLESRNEIDLRIRVAALSPRGDLLLGATRDGTVYTLRSDSTLHSLRNAVPVLSVQKENEREAVYFRSFGFSDQGKWAFAGAAGDMFIWRPGEHFPTRPVPTFRSSYPFSRFGITPKEKWATLVTDDTLYLKDLTSPEALIRTLPAYRHMSNILPTFSHAEDRVAMFRGLDVIVYDLTFHNFGQSRNYLLAFPEPDSLRTISYGGSVYFSPNDQWLVIRPSFQGFFVLNVSTPTGTKIRPSIDISEEERNRGDHSDRGGLVDFAPSSDWVAGSTGDHSLYVWRTDKTPDASIEPVVPAENYRSSIFSETFPTAEFSPDGKWVAASSADGSVYVWPIGQRPILTNPLHRHDFGIVNFSWAADGGGFYSFAGSDLFWASVAGAGETRGQVVRAPSRINKLIVSPDRKQLVLFEERHIQILRRRLFLFGIPIYDFDWPMLL